VSRRVRALAFLVAALACAGLAAAIAGGYGASVADQLGELRPVLVATSELRARRPITAQRARRALEVRRVPVRFAPAGALASPTQALGREPAVDIAAGDYVTAGQLRTSESDRRDDRSILPPGLSPVEIQVTGAGTLSGTRTGGQTSVDVVVTTEPGPGASGRTFVAATAVPLLALTQAGAGLGETPPAATALSTSVATLALTRAQALRLIDAESFAREIRLIPRG
jgi:Flp pilus assembly protein CpaB